MTDLIGETLNELANIQDELINFLDDETANNEEFNQLLFHLDNSDIIKTSSQMYLFLQCLGNIINYHYERVSKLDYLKKIINHLSNKITELLNQTQLFYIAKNSKLLLLTLIKTRILDIDFFVKYLIRLCPNSNLAYYLTPEFKEYSDKHTNQLDSSVQEFFSSKEIIYNSQDEGDNSDDEENNDYEIVHENLFEMLHIDMDEYIELREKGENTSIFTKQIQEDNFEDFNILMEKNGMKINKRIDFQIYDSHDYPLFKNTMPSIFEYAAYNGSLEICKYLTLQNANYESQSWLYAIHGRNAEIIHLLEEHGIECKYSEAFLYAIKCHNNNFAEYIHGQSSDDSLLIQGIIECISSYNFLYLKTLLSIIESDDDQKLSKSELIEKFIKCGYSNTVDHIIKTKQNENKPEELIEFAIEANNSNLIEILFENSTEFTIKWVEKAIEQDHFDALKILLEKEPIQKLITTVFFLSIFLMILTFFLSYKF